LVKFFVTPPEYKVIVFSEGFGDENLEDEKLCEVCDLIKKYVS